MNTHILKTAIATTAAIVILGIAGTALASDTSGRLSTGIGGNIGSDFNGTVISPVTAAPPAGAYDSSQSVILTASGATAIYYTVDGSIPTCSSGTPYTSAISVSSSEAILARSCYGGSASSTVASFLYAINPPSGNSGTNSTSNTSSIGGGGGGGGGGGSSGTSLFTKGDSNLDGHINILDFVTLMADWGQTGSGNPADFNGDGSVGIQDFVTLMANWTN